MSEWWTYSLSSFLMFSPRTYWRTLELYNLAFWPAHLLALALGLTLLWLARSRRVHAGRVLLALLAALWLWVGWAFHLQHYASINLAAQYFALAFALQAALLLGLGAVQGKASVPPAGGVGQQFGWLLALTGVLFYPLAGLLAGRPWTQIELFGMTPEPTALATLGLLWASAQPPSRPRRFLLAIIPAAYLLVGMATLWLIADPGSLTRER